jgi:simple sugar transport system ATP-binding protein
LTDVLSGRWVIVSSESGAAGSRSGGSLALDVRGITKRYSHVEALRGCDLDVREAEIVGIVGDNGAGKSTLMKTLTGVIRPDSGEIVFRGQPVQFSSPGDARAIGIDAVYQDLALAEDLSAADNFYLGHELLKPGIRGRLGILDRRAMRAETVNHFKRYDVRLAGASVPVGAMSGGQKQSVAVIRSVAWKSAVVFMDEPTAALGVMQTARVLDLIRLVRDEGTAVVMISHDLPHLLEVADRVHVMRMGMVVATFGRADASPQAIVDVMAGVGEA